MQKVIERCATIPVREVEEEQRRVGHATLEPLCDLRDNLRTTHDARDAARSSARPSDDVSARNGMQTLASMH